MMGSLYSAISGLKNHQIKMDVIGNNIANVNTTGFKESDVTFATALSQTMKGASAPTTTQGGTNPAQVGMGSMLGSINQIMTAGNSETTGKDTDLMLQGSGFFVLDNNGQQVFTRAGGFDKDTAGNLVDPATGAKVQGYSWNADDTTTPDWSKTGDINFNLGDTLATDSGMPVATTSVLLNDSPTTGTFTAESSGPPVVPATYDTGSPNATNVTIDGMTKVSSDPTTGQFSYDATTGIITFAQGFVPPSSYTTPPGGLNLSYVPLANMGTVTDLNNTATVDYAPAAGATVYNDAGGTNTPYTLTTAATPGDGEYSVKAVNGKYQITFGTDGTGTATPTIAAPSISYDFTNKAHTLTSFSIDQNGVITGAYSNGVDTVNHKIAQIEVALFANETGLQNTGGSFYTQTTNSGAASIGAAGDGGRATVAADTLEMSNVDLSTEMTDMITAQRGFQANSRVITVSDSLLQELIDLKRQ
ncbi:MAG: flagellar hook-basal body complex protein [Desulfosporosinus sp.]|nr:flagellar hook-basal body complex protein [Desulfosporosinus sp.]